MALRVLAWETICLPVNEPQAHVSGEIVPSLSSTLALQGLTHTSTRAIFAPSICAYFERKWPNPMRSTLVVSGRMPLLFAVLSSRLEPFFDQVYAHVLVVW